jgi:aspartyl-tRNA(Asn)/glutamyl-tRNA(Gln) amidotransferase subunit C
MHMADTLTQEQVAHVAHLARLELSEQETATYAHQLSDILASFEQLNQVNTDDVQPVAQVTGLENVLQNDVVGADSVSRETFLQDAPAAESPYIKVKAVLE